MANTQTSLVNKVLSNLSVLGATDTASAEDAAAVSGLLRPTIAKYIALGVDMSADATDLSDIPDAIFLPLADLIAFEAATPFQIGGAKLIELAQLREKAESDLRRIYRQGFSPRRLNMPRIGRRYPYPFNWTTGQ